MAVNNMTVNENKNKPAPISNKERQAAHCDRQRAKGRVGRKVWATPKEHDSIQELLTKIRGE